MRSILETCIAMDELTSTAYESMARHAANPELIPVFERLAVEERDHLGWWTGLIEAWDRGLVPDIVNDTEGLERHLKQIHAEIAVLVPDDMAAVTDDMMLDIAARMEFLMTDPVFGELLELTEPGGARTHRAAYARHLERIVNAIEMYYGRPDLGRFLAGVIRRAWRDNLALTTYATRDPLTALHNRRGLMTYLEQWVSWADRYRRPLGLLLVDVDDFKKINDNFGQAVGDLALKAVASALEQAIRGSDFVARYGGDEFAIVAPESDDIEMAALAQRLVDSVAGLALLDWDGTAVPLGISVGGAVLSPANGPGDDMDGFLALANRSLYEAKQDGKARVGHVAAFPAAFGDT